MRQFDVPHSRWNVVTHDDLAAAGLQILVESDEANDHNTSRSTKDIKKGAKDTKKGPKGGKVYSGFELC